MRASPASPPLDAVHAVRQLLRQQHPAPFALCQLVARVKKLTGTQLEPSAKAWFEKRGSEFLLEDCGHGNFNVRLRSDLPSVGSDKKRQRLDSGGDIADELAPLAIYVSNVNWDTTGCLLYTSDAADE